uniref:Chromo domain-containing protein n=1 Tax=Laticauda laticaudata TaxID=8630 RepID=A0A8C5SB36_LATLA
SFSNSHQLLFFKKENAAPKPLLIAGHEHYEVKKILDSRIFRGKLQYLIYWKGGGSLSIPKLTYA